MQSPFQKFEKQTITVSLVSGNALKGYAEYINIDGVVLHGVKQYQTNHWGDFLDTIEFVFVPTTNVKFITLSSPTET